MTLQELLERPEVGVVVDHAGRHRHLRLLAHRDLTGAAGRRHRLCRGPVSRIGRRGRARHGCRRGRGRWRHDRLGHHRRFALGDGVAAAAGVLDLATIGVGHFAQYRGVAAGAACRRLEVGACFAHALHARCLQVAFHHGRRWPGGAHGGQHRQADQQGDGRGQGRGTGRGPLRCEGVLHGAGSCAGVACGYRNGRGCGTGLGDGAP